MRAQASVCRRGIAEQFLGALDVSLTEEEMKYLEEPYRPLKIIGHA